MKKFVSIILPFFMVLLFLIALIPVYLLSNKKLAEHMIKEYSDDKNYVSLSGEILELNEYYVIIKCPEIHTYIDYQIDICDYYIYSDEALNLVAGDIIDFITVPCHFYDGHKLPIVEVKKGNETLLAFEDGKANLLEWVQTTFN